ncbi:MAG: hypothetical protein F7C35_09115 [Desulfurococcales archaeon]|nr:hypothetical protein [Desulfurococcales archaeon]
MNNIGLSRNYRSILSIVVVFLMLLSATGSIGVSQGQDQDVEYRAHSIVYSASDITLYNGLIGANISYGSVYGLYLQAIGGEYAYEQVMYDNDYGIFRVGENYSTINLEDEVDTVSSNSSSNLSASVALTNSGNITLGNTTIMVERNFTVISGLPLIIVKTRIVNTGNETITGYQFYEYIDVDLESVDNDYIEVPLRDQGITRLNVEAYIPASDLGEPWLWQKDTETPLNVAFLIGSLQSLDGVYVTYYHGEDLPERVVVDGETITTGDIVVAIAWNMTLTPGQAGEYVYAYAVPQNYTDISNLYTYVLSSSILTAYIDAPAHLFWGQTSPVRLQLQALTNTSVTASVNLTVTSPLTITPDSFTGILLDPQNGTRSTNVTALLGAPTGWVGVAEIRATIAFNYTDPASSREMNGTITLVARVTITPSPYMYTNTSILEVEGTGSGSVIHTVPESLYHTSNITVGAGPHVLYIEEVRSLIGYPYGCAEQRTSKLLAVIEAYDYLYHTGHLSSNDAATYNQYIIGGVLDLIEQQHGDGGWGWYPDLNSTPFFTIYVLTGLARAGVWADYHGIYIPNADNGESLRGSLENGLSYLETTQNSNGSWTGSGDDYVKHPVILTAYALQAISLIHQAEPDIAVNQSMVEGAVEYLLSAQTTGGAWPLSGAGTPDPLATAATVIALTSITPLLQYYGLTDLTTQAVNASVQGAHWLEDHAEQDSDGYYWTSDSYIWSSSTSIVTAMSVRAIHAALGNTTAVQEGMRWLIENAEDWLHSTTRAGAVVVGTINLISLENMQPEIPVSVFLNGEEIWNGTISAGTWITLPADTVEGANNLSVTVNGAGKVYASITTVYWLETQQSLKVSPHGSGGSGSQVILSPAVDEFTWTFEEPQPDGTIATHLVINLAQPAYFLVLDIPIPPGYTINLTELKGQGVAIDRLEPVLSIAIPHIDTSKTIDLELIPTTRNQTLATENLMPARLMGMYNLDLQMFSTLEIPWANLPGQTTNTTGSGGNMASSTTNTTTGSQTQTETGGGGFSDLLGNKLMLVSLAIILVLIVGAILALKRK